MVFAFESQLLAPSVKEDRRGTVSPLLPTYTSCIFYFSKKKNSGRTNAGKVPMFLKTLILKTSSKCVKFFLIQAFTSSAELTLKKCNYNLS